MINGSTHRCRPNACTHARECACTRARNRTRNRTQRSGTRTRTRTAARQEPRPTESHPASNALPNRLQPQTSSPLPSALSVLSVISVLGELLLQLLLDLRAIQPGAAQRQDQARAQHDQRHRQRNPRQNLGPLGLGTDFFPRDFGT